MPAFGAMSKNSMRILARQIGDRDDLPFLPQQAIGKARDVAHVDAARRPRGRPCAPPAAPPAQARPTGAKMIAQSSGSGGGSSEPPAQPAPSLRAKSCAGDIARPREGENVAALPAGDLRDDVRGGAEAVEAELSPLARDRAANASRSVRRTAAARSRRIAVRRQRKDETRVGDDMRRVAAVAGVAGEQRPIAQVLLSARAVGGRHRRCAPSHGTPTRIAERAGLRRRCRRRRSVRRSRGRG